MKQQRPSQVLRQPLNMFRFYIEANHATKGKEKHFKLLSGIVAIVYLRYTEHLFIPLFPHLQNSQHPALIFARASYARKSKYGKEMPIQTVKMCLATQWAFMADFILF